MTDENLKQVAENASRSSRNPCKLTWENLRFEVTSVLHKEEAARLGQKTAKLEIIKSVSGYALPGQTCYIMGSSGAGKTTLLNILSDRIAVRSGSKLEGKVYVNDNT